MYKRIPAGLIIIMFFVANGYSQSQKAKSDTGRANKVTLSIPEQSSTITLHLNKEAGVGPNGFSASTIAETELLKNSSDPFYVEEYKAYPQMKHKPVLDDMVEYFYILDDAQFYFQNYVAGIYSKAFLTKKFGHIKRALADTIELLRNPVNCYISAIGGYNTDHKPVYMLDINNNGDFADDQLTPALFQLHSEDQLVKASQNVNVTYAYKGQIKGGTKRVTPQFANRDGNKFGLTFAFPEYGALKFTYKGGTYKIVGQAGYNQNYYVVVPYGVDFVGKRYSEGIINGQFIKLGEDTFGLTSVADDGNEITFKGVDISGFSLENAIGVTYGKGKARSTENIVSRQKGFLAPAISGTDMNPAASLGRAISLAKLKGKYVFVDIWSTTCGPCIAEFPFLKRAYDTYKDKIFMMLG